MSETENMGGHRRYPLAVPPANGVPVGPNVFPELGSGGGRES